MGDWANGLKSKVKEKLSDTKERDLRFFRIEEFLRNVTRTGEFSTKCPRCASYKIDIEAVVEKIDEAIQVPGKSRREYDGLISMLSTHMRKEHDFYPPYYYTYLYSSVGTVLGLILGFLVYKFYPSSDFITFVVGFIIGILSGNMVGTRKDKKIRNENRLM